MSFISNIQRIVTMNDRETILNGIGDDIKKIMYAYVNAKSYTNTVSEKNQKNS